MCYFPSYSTDEGQVNVTIAGTTCDVSSVNDTSVECVTQAHRPSVKTKVDVSVGSKGIATQVYHYPKVISNKLCPG